MKANAQETDLNECRKQYRKVYPRTNIVGLNNGITDDILCAKDKINNADTCEGCFLNFTNEHTKNQNIFR